MTMPAVITPDQITATTPDSIPSPAPAAAPSAADTPAPDFDAPESTPEATPPPAAGPNWDSDDNPYRQKFTEMEQRFTQVDQRWQAEEQAKQRQQQEQYQQTQQQEIQGFAEALQYANVPPDVAQRYGSVFAVGLQLQSPQVQEQLKQTWTYAGQRAASDEAWSLAAELLGPQTTIAQVNAFRQQLLQYTDPKLMRQAAEVLASNRRESNRREAVQSGRERVEGGVPNSAGATDYRTLVDRVSNGTATPQEQVRLQKMWDQGIYS